MMGLADGIVTSLPLSRLDGKVALVTGASQGMGREIARGLASLGAEVLIVARDPERTRAAAEDIRSTTQNASVRTLLCDLASVPAVKQLAALVAAQHPVIDILVNNAGGHFQRRSETADGIERSWAINFVAPFLLTQLLIDNVRAAKGGRIVNVASDAMSKTLTCADLDSHRSFNSWRAYGESKLALVMYTYYLAGRLRSDGITSNALHPGLVATSVADAAAPLWLPRWILSVIKPFLLSPQAGARSALALAAAADVAGTSGLYFRRGHETRSTPISYEASEQLRVVELATRLTGIATGGRP